MLQAAPTVAAGHQAAELGVVNDPELLRLLVGPLQLVRRDDFREVEQGSLGRGDRNVVDDGAVVGMKGAGAMHGDAVTLPARVANDGDVDVETVRPPNVPEHRCVAMAQNRAASTGNYCGQPFAAKGRWRRSHEVDAVVLSREPPLGNASRDRRLVETDDLELACGDDAVVSPTLSNDAPIELRHQPSEGVVDVVLE